MTEEEKGEEEVGRCGLAVIRNEAVKVGISTTGESGGRGICCELDADEI